MQIRIEVDGKEKKVELPFWQGFKVYIVSYLAFLGMIFLVAFFFGLFMGV